jgi:tetratricopeptide (TPR) repeat protein
MARSAKSLVVFLLGFAVGCQEVGARRQIQEGNKRYYDGKYDEAIKEYSEALGVDKELGIGWYNLGLAHLALFAPGLKTPENEKHAQGAIDALSQYLRIEPTDTTARDYLLSTYIDSGHYEGAIQYFEAKLQKDPADIEAVAQLAQINQSAGKFDEAIKWHKKRAEMVATTDLKADSWYSIGVLDWRRLNNHPEVTGAERVRIGDEGIGWLQKADSVRKAHSPTLSYLNLLYRERSAGTDASYARAVDTASAQVYYKLATEAAKKQ